MFILNVLKIFLRNKKNELKPYINRFINDTIDHTLDFISIAIIAILLAATVFGIVLGIGYVGIELLHLSEIQDGDAFNSYGRCGLAMVVLGGIIFFVMYLIGKVVIWIGKFIRWIWSNIKIAIAEAKEIQ